MTTSPQAKLLYSCSVLAAASLGAVQAFQSPLSMLPCVARQHSSALFVAVDPSTVSNKDYEDICGVSFDDLTLGDRLQRTSYLYPKHVEVIEDLSDIASTMVDEVVSTWACARVEDDMWPRIVYREDYSTARSRMRCCVTCVI